MFGTHCYLEIDLWRMVGVKALSGSATDACLCKESQGWHWASIFLLRRQALSFVSCKMILPMHRVDFEWIWKGLKSLVLSCRCQEIQEVRNVLETWCDATWSNLSVLHQPPQHLYLERFKQETHNSSWDFMGGASARKSKLISKTKTGTKCHVTW